MTLAELNALDADAYLALLGKVYEHSPWVAARAWLDRPFASVDALHAAMMRAVHDAPRAARLALIRAHPELAGREAKAGALTRDSSGEQGRLGFTALNRTEMEKMAALNRAYREKFGFPCIVALRLHATRAEVIAQIEHRLDSALEAEVTTALEQIGHITQGRLEGLIAED